VGAVFQRAVSAGCEEDESRFDANGLQRGQDSWSEGANMDGNWERLGGIGLPDLYNDAELNSDWRHYPPYIRSVVLGNQRCKYHQAIQQRRSPGKDLWMSGLPCRGTNRQDA